MTTEELRAAVTAIKIRVDALSQAIGSTGSRLGLLVPAYWDPNVQPGDTDALIAAATKVPMIVIVNPDSGPGVGVDPAYSSFIARAAAAGIRVIGYVSTGNGGRPAADVLAYINRWWNQYPGASGIFLDQMPTAATYATLYAGYILEARRLFPGRFVVVNPGAWPHRSYYDIGKPDVIVMSENAGTNVTLPIWAVEAPDANFGVLAHGSSADVMRAVVANARILGIGFLYVTDDADLNVWDRLPAYWSAEVDAVRAA